MILDVGAVTQDVFKLDFEKEIWVDAAENVEKEHDKETGVDTAKLVILPWNKLQTQASSQLKIFDV